MAALGDIIARSPAVLSRRVDPRAALSLVWGQVAAGTAVNVIPDSGEASASVRVFDVEVWKQAGSLVGAVIRDLAQPYGVDVDITYRSGVPPAVNEAVSTKALEEAAMAVLGAGSLHLSPRAWGARTLPGSWTGFPDPWAALASARPPPRR